MVERLPEATPNRPRSSTRTRSGSRGCGGTPSAPQTACALMAAGNEPAEAAIRANTLRTTAEELAAAAPGARGPGAARGADPRRALRHLRARSEWEQRPADAAGRAAMAVSRALAPEAGRARARPVRRARRQDHTPRRADGRRGRDRRRRAAPRPRRARCADRERMGATIVDVRTADAARAAARLEFDRVLVDPPCSDLGTLAEPPRRALAQGRPPGGAGEACNWTSSTAGAMALSAAVPSCTRRARSRPSRTSASWQPSWPLTKTSPLPIWARTCPSGSIRPCRSTCRRSRTATAPTVSSSRGCDAHDVTSTSATSARPAMSRGCGRPTFPAATAA